MRYVAVISYFGANYVGWQRQLNGLSVQETLEKAMSKAFGEEVSATASGRTDAGVHALAQVVHFDVNTSIPTDKIPFAVNSCLPSDISMLSCEVAPDDFNARFSAKKKTYCYKLYLSRHPRPMLESTHEHIVVPLDLNVMREGASVIEGEHDFKCFEATGSVIKNTVRTVYGVDIKVSPLERIDGVFGEGVCDKDDGVDGRIFDCTVEISVTGNGFLYNMVRIIAGTLVYMGMGKLTTDDLKIALATCDRTLVGKTLPPHGLHLLSVKYN
ncbi:MAG: tRNA pseudouridine(38-40) synthase TruA [Bacteroides sp.]|nr:tRNA pseudouridine(38-40) synthase TruA [Bacillota bacterium]MCM1393758.1 tRNA pseudouridine(38-40) synthase TruA [[Eubacterium] siraeum]MCM1454941.1 tRNA pseudouridine(38-40) synthase TruA [Bacteroides sp.]